MCIHIEYMLYVIRSHYYMLIFLYCFTNLILQCNKSYITSFILIKYINQSFPSPFHQEAMFLFNTVQNIFLHIYFVKQNNVRSHLQQKCTELIYQNICSQACKHACSFELFYEESKKRGGKGEGKDDMRHRQHKNMIHFLLRELQGRHNQLFQLEKVNCERAT